MTYNPKIIIGKVKDTGLPIDGHTLYFSQWDYDNYESWHLYNWNDKDDEVVMLTVWQTENEAGLESYDTFEEFAAVWRAGAYETDGTFCLALDKVEVLEIKQEEQKEE